MRRLDERTASQVITCDELDCAERLIVTEEESFVPSLYRKKTEAWQCGAKRDFCEKHARYSVCVNYLDGRIEVRKEHGGHFTHSAAIEYVLQLLRDRLNDAHRRFERAEEEKRKALDTILDWRRKNPGFLTSAVLSGHGRAIIGWRGCARFAFRRVPMGVSTDAILFFGVLLVEGSVPNADFDDIEDDDATVSPIARAVYYGSTIDGTRVSVVRHQSASCPMYALAITDTIMTAWRGSPLAISFDQQRELVGNEHEAMKEILDLAKQHGLELDGDGVPKWYMASWWSE